MRQWAIKLGKELFSGNLSVLTQRSKPCSVCSAFCGSGCTLGPDMQPRHLWLRVEQLPHQPVMHRTPRHTKPCTCWCGKTSSCRSCAVSSLVLHNEYAQSELTKQYTEVKVFRERKCLLAFDSLQREHKAPFLNNKASYITPEITRATLSDTHKANTAQQM